MSSELWSLINRDFPISTLILPKPEKYSLTDTSTFAPAAQVRSSPRNTLMDSNVPQKKSTNVLQHMGLDDLEKIRPDWFAPKLNQPKRGVFVPMTSIGLSAAFFADQQHEDDARTELSDDYEFIRDFRMQIPTPVRGQHRGAAPLTMAQWPEESGVPEAHREGIKGSDVLVGVLDTGVDADHDEFVHQTVTYRYVSLFPNSPYWPPRDVRGFDTDGHGTHVSGIIAGRTVGVAPEASLYVASVIEAETTSTGLIRTTYGLNWLLRQFSRPDNEHRPAVLNMSIGFPKDAPDQATPTPYEQRLRVMETLLQTLKQANVLPVIAIGNDGAGNYSFPGAFRNVVGVGAVDFDKQLAAFSGGGNVHTGLVKPDLMGYGVGVYSSVERSYNGRSIYQRLSGTSMATPYTAGVAALYRCQQPALTVDEVRDRLLDTAIQLNGRRDRVGAGLGRFRRPSVVGRGPKVTRKRQPVRRVRR